VERSKGEKDGRHFLFSFESFFFHFFFFFGLVVWFSWGFYFLFIPKRERKKKFFPVAEVLPPHCVHTPDFHLWKPFRELGRLVFDQLWFSFSFRLGLRPRGMGGWGRGNVWRRSITGMG
jgi:hypothetical protein